MRALISAYDKTGLVPFARGLTELGCELVASGGTAQELADAGLPVTRVEDVTGFPELLEGRVKTLHPRIHAGILARADSPQDRAALDAHGIEPYDLVCVSLYPFELAVDRPQLDEAGLIEMIDIGGPALLRAAAKNFASVLAVCRPQDYDIVLSELREHDGASTPQLRRRLAAIAFARTAAYESAIARGSSAVTTSPRPSSPRSTACASCRTARTRTSAPRTTPSAAPARICSRSSSNVRARSSRSTT